MLRQDLGVSSEPLLTLAQALTLALALAQALAQALALALALALTLILALPLTLPLPLPLTDQVSSELFASPLNCRFPRFCSAAADADAPFGSAGSFFASHLRSGADLAHPTLQPCVHERLQPHATPGCSRVHPGCNRVALQAATAWHSQAATMCKQARTSPTPPLTRGSSNG